MSSPRRKARWSAEKRATKGHSPQRRTGGRPTDADAPLNRKQRRALQFGDTKGGPADRSSQSTERRTESGRDDRRTQGRRDDRKGPRRDDRFEGRRDDRPRDDRYQGRRDDRFEGNRDDRPRDDRYQGRRDDRFESRQGDRFGDRRRDDRPRDDRYQGRQGDRFGDRRRDDRPRDDRYQGRQSDRYGDRRQGDRYEGRRDDRYEGRQGDRYEDRRDGGDRYDDAPRSRHHGDGPRRPAAAQRRFEPRRDREPRGHVERRRPFDREPRDEQQVESDQMSWTAQTAESVEGDLESGFFGLGVAEPLVRVLAAQGITEPFPIQSATIGDALAGRDVLGRGRTGSGKTLAFGLPMLTRLAEGSPVGSPRAMILTPTRELALQIADNLSPLAAVVGIDLTLIAGGMSYGPQLRAFERGVDVVVATPGRLIDLMEQGAADLSQVEIAVLDEADHMADLGFLNDVRTLLDACGDGQRLLFSATLDDAVDKLVQKYLHDPVTHEVDSEKASVTTMVHRPLLVKPHHKNQVTAEIANREGRTVLFARTQMGTDRIATQLREAGVMAGALHGGLTQGARARILSAFREGTVPVLVATDVAARGIHVDDVTLVLQVDPPHDSKDYLHRAGRTARAGQEGVVATVVLPHQRKLARRLLGQAGVDATPLDVEPSTPELREATGARPTSGVAIREEDYLTLIAPKQQPRRRHDGQRGGGRGRRPHRRGDRY